MDEIYPPTYYSFASGGELLAPRRNLVTRAKDALDRRQFRRVLDMAAAGAEPRVLDVGGGTGEIAASLVAASGGAARATVVDIDERSIEAAQARGLDAFCGRFEDFEPGERFDVVLMLNLLEHVADPMAVLRKGRDVLRPGGVLWLQTPNFRSLDARLFRNRNWAGLHCPRHWVVFSRQGLERALGQAGFGGLQLEHTQGGAFWAASLLGLRRSKSSGAGKPLVASPAFLPLAAAGAAFDLATRPLRPTSQVVAIARA